MHPIVEIKHRSFTHVARPLGVVAKSSRIPPLEMQERRRMNDDAIVSGQGIGQFLGHGLEVDGGGHFHLDLKRTKRL